MRIFPGWKAESRCLAVSVCILIGFAGCTGPSVEKQMRLFGGTVVSPVEISSALRSSERSVVTVTGLDSRGNVLGYGSGFYVGSNQVATCLHVIEPAARVQISCGDGSSREITGVFGVDPNLDLAVLWTTNAPPDEEWFDVRRAPAIDTEPVFLIGGPHTAPNRFTRGTVLGTSEIGGWMTGRAINLSVPAVPGFSGGPVIDEHGNALGIMSSVLGSRSPAGAIRTSVAVPAADLVPLLQSRPTEFFAWRTANPAPAYPAFLEVDRGETLSFTDAKAALVHFDRAVQLAPDFKRAWLGKSACLERLKQYEAAAGAYRKVLELDPGLDTIRAMLALTLSRLNQPGEAEEVLAPLLARNPESVAGLSCLTTIRMTQDDWKGALNAAYSLIKAAPKRDVGYEFAGTIWSLWGDTTRAFDTFQSAADLDPSKARHWRRLSRIAAETGHDGGGLKAVELLSAFPRDADSAGDVYVASLLHLRNGDLRSAKTEFAAAAKEEAGLLDRDRSKKSYTESVARVFKEGVESPDAHRQLGVYFFQTKRVELALIALEHAARVDPGDVDGWITLGTLSIELLRLQRAKQAAGTALSLQPTNNSAHVVLGRAAAFAGDFTSARNELESYLANGGDGDAADVILFCIETKLGNDQAAKKHLERVRRIDPETASALEANPNKFMPNAADIQSFEPTVSPSPGGE
jgi:tetratricopeptide (TPR) repeat protein